MCPCSSDILFSFFLCQGALLSLTEFSLKELVFCSFFSQAQPKVTFNAILAALALGIVKCHHHLY
jgi:hypothetical protein